MHNDLFDRFFDDPGEVIETWLHHGSSHGLLLLGAGLLAAFGFGLASQAYLRARHGRLSWSGIARGVLPLGWLLPVAGIFVLYGMWLRPSFMNVPAPAPAPATIAERQSTTTVAPTAGSPAPKTEASNTTQAVPAWINEKDVETPSGRLVVVEGKLCPTDGEARSDVRAEAANAVRDDFASVYPDAAGWSPPVHVVNKAAVKQVYVARTSEKTPKGFEYHLYRAYAQVELSPAVRQQIFPSWRSEVVGRRIWAMGGLASLLTLTFATLATYFRLDERTSGVYRRRLKLAAVSVIAAGGFAAATLL